MVLVEIPCAKRIKIVVSIVLVLILACVGLFLTGYWNDYFFHPVQTSEVATVTIKIRELFPEDIAVEIDSQESIEQISATEELVRKSDGECFLIKARPWQIEYEYLLTDGKKIRRSYRGQKSLVELQNAFADVSEIKSHIDES